MRIAQARPRFITHLVALLTLCPLVANALPPSFTSLPNTAATQDAPYAYNITATDPDIGDVLTITATGAGGGALPGWLGFVDNGNGTATLSGTPTNAEVGNHDVELTVTDLAMETGVQNFTIIVANVNDAPTFTSTPVLTATEGVEYLYNITTEDIDGDNVSILDTSVPAWLTLTDNGNGTGELRGTPTGADLGVNGVTLTVRDPSLASNDQAFNINVSAGAGIPVITILGDNPATVGLNQPYVDAGATASDPEDGDLTGAIVVDNPVDTSIAGDYFVTYTVTDSAANMVQAQRTVSVTSSPPAFTSTPVTMATQDAVYTYNITTTDPDAGEALTISAPTLPAWLVGGFSDNGDGTATLTGTPGALDVGDHNVVLQVADTSNPPVQQAFTITVDNVNDQPTFDSTPVLSVNQNDVYTYNIVVGDLDPGDTITITAPTLPAWLTLTDNGDRTATLTGTPTNDDVGDHDVTLEATDGIAPAVQQNFTVTVVDVNDPPVLDTPIPDQQANEDAPFSLVVAGNFSDPDAGDTLTFSASGLPPSFSIDSASGEISGTPDDPDVAGSPYTVTVTASDGTAGTDDIFQLLVNNTVNDLPVILGQADPNLSTPEDMSISLVGADLNIQDPDNPPPMGFTVNVQDGMNYTVGGSGNTVTPDEDFNGDLMVPVTVTDPDGGESATPFTMTITVTPVPDAPELVMPIPDQLATEGSLFQLDLSQGFFADVDPGDTFTYAVAGLPPSGNLTIDALSGIISGTPLLEDTSDTPIVIDVTVTDSGGLTLDTSFNLTIAALDRADLSLDTDGNGAAPALTNDNINFSFSVDNGGPQDAPLVDVTAVFAGNPVVFSDLGSCTASSSGDTQIVICTIGPIAAGGSASANFSGSAAQAGDISIMARADVSGALPIDPNLDNNSSDGALSVADQLSGGPSQSIASDNSNAVQLADLDGDGLTDLVVATGAGRATELYVNDGARGLVDNAVRFGDTGASRGVTVDDFDQDGDQDAATANDDAMGNNVFLNPGDGTLVLDSTLGSDTSLDVDSADLDGDGFPDLAFANASPNRIYLNQGDGTFAAFGALTDDSDSRGIALADLTGDDVPDLVVANADNPSGYHENLGGGNFGTLQPIDLDAAESVASGDFNGDGREDLVFARLLPDSSGSRANPVYLNTGGAFVQNAMLGELPTLHVLVEDVSLDGNLDIVTINETGTHQIYVGDGAGNFTLHPEQFVSNNARRGAFGDINGDGRNDLVIGGSTGNEVFFNDGEGNLGAGDVTAPTISLLGPGSVNLDVGEAYTDQGATASDNVDGDITDQIVTDNPVDTSIVGTYTVTYTVTDNSGNEASPVTRTVQVGAITGQGGGGGGALNWLLAFLLIFARCWQSRIKKSRSML